VYADTPDADPRLAGMTLEAHLEKLVDEGRVHREGARIALAGAGDDGGTAAAPSDPSDG
jgi:hypothetical protein